MSQQKISVRILNKEYQFACEDHERASLIAAADCLDKAMQSIKSMNSTMSSDKVTLMAAMNIAHELIKAQQLLEQHNSEIMNPIKKLNDKLEQALGQSV